MRAGRRGRDHPRVVERGADRLELADRQPGALREHLRRRRGRMRVQNRQPIAVLRAVLDRRALHLLDAGVVVERHRVGHRHQVEIGQRSERFDRACANAAIGSTDGPVSTRVT